MPQRTPQQVTPDEILAFCFPTDLTQGVAEIHMKFWQGRMQGGMDAAILDRYADATHAAARGAFDTWAETPRGRLALILLLDQFPRSVWRGTPAAYGQDIKSCRLVLDSFANGRFDTLTTPWEQNFPLIAVTHCEGPDHLARMDLVIEITDRLVDALPQPMNGIYQPGKEQPRRVREVIRRFGRHPHRNTVPGRVSTAVEDAYIAAGEFPHERPIEAPG